MRRMALGALLAALPLLAACSGIGLGEGAGPPNLGPLPPPNLDAPIYNGELSGRIVFDQGFLEHQLLASPGVPRATQGRTEGPALDADRAYLASLEVLISGGRPARRARVDDEGRFDLGRVRHGEYTLVLVEGRGGRPRRLAEVPVHLDGQSTMSVTLRILGTDMAGLTGQDDPWALFIEKEVAYRSELIEYRRVHPPAGDVRTYLPDGSVEVQAPDGIVKVTGPTGRVTYRRDPQNRFADVEADPDTGVRRAPRPVAGPDPLWERLEGKSKAPLVTSVTVEPRIGTGAGGLAIGDLAVLSVRTDANGGSLVRRVEAQVFTAVGGARGRPTVSKRTLAVLDDGGRSDLDPSSPGVQSSLDAVAGDGTFTGVLVLDRARYPIYRACQIVTRAHNERGLASRPASFHLYLPRVVPRRAPPLSVSEAVLHRDVRGRHSARVVLGSPLEGVTATWVGPGGFRRVLAQRTPTLLVAAPVHLDAAGTYGIVVGGPGGEVHYATVVVGSDELTRWVGDARRP